MSKIRFTKGELKRQRDALRQYERYLPTLQLKKQQLQIEIVRELSILNDRRGRERERTKAVERWIGLLSDKSINIKPWIGPQKVITGVKNIAGVDLPVFERVEFAAAEYDLFVTPLWIDSAIEQLLVLTSLREEIKILETGVAILRAELRVTTQRVNLFEKVKIPDAEKAIRLIKIYIGDQMANAVGRSKIAKRKIEEAAIEMGVAA